MGTHSKPVGRRVSGTEASLLTATLVVTITLAETALYLDEPVPAISVYVGLLVASAIAPFRSGVDTGVFQAFALVAAFRILDLGLPTHFGDPLVRVFVVYLPVAIAAGLVLVRSPPRNNVDVDVRALLLLPVILILGSGIAALEYATYAPPSLLTDGDPYGVVTFVLVVGVLLATTEELLFRGLLQGAVRNQLGPSVAVAASAVVYGALYATWQSPVVVGVGVLLGTIYAVVYEALDDLLSVILIHVTANLILYGMLPL